MRTHTCGELRAEHIGQTVTLCGWVQKSRDLGYIRFTDLRDRYGITQISVKSDEMPEMYKQTGKLGREFVLRVTGEVVERESKNPNIPTGEVEITPTEIEVLNPSKLPPFLIEDDTDGGEELRMEYRYLDLRRPRMQRNLMLRARMMQSIRNYLSERDFVEVETPFFIRSTPEGARDFLVPSRLHPGNFYALPQSPQILKQLLMVSGLDRYFQIVKCFRDEDFRGDRQPEFTQLDCEMSFVNQEDVLSAFDGMTRQVFRDVIGIDLPELPRLTYGECMARFGTDKPDLRFRLEFVEMNRVMGGTDFGVFNEILDKKGLIVGFVIRGKADYSRKQLDALTKFVRDPKIGGSGVAYVKYNADGTTKSSVDKFYDEDHRLRLLKHAHAEPGDLLVMVADRYKSKARKILGQLRLHIGRTEDLIKENAWSVFYVVDFPLFEEDEETGKLTFAHHPFCMPHPDDLQYLESNPRRVRAQSYDMVINGNEILSGSIRVHDRGIQAKIFDILGLSEAEQEEKFGFMLRAFEYGAPPHGGCAFGIDRWAMLMAGEDSIRDVMAFPKTAGGRDLMMDAPAAVPTENLDELGIRVVKQPDAEQ